MKILVTGGAGFIGSHLVNKLLNEGEEVMVLDNLSRGKSENVPDSARFIVMDIRDPRIAKLFKSEHFDAVVHLAGQTMVSASIKNPVLDARENIFGLINLLQAVRYSGVRRFIFSSTAAVYGDVSEEYLPISEHQTPAPTSFYGLSKLTAERYIIMYQSMYGLDYVILRFSNVFGELQGDSSEGGVISIFSKCVANQLGGGV